MARGLRLEIALGSRDQVEDAVVKELVHRATEYETIGRRVRPRAANNTVLAVAQFGSKADGDTEPKRRFRVLQRSDRVRDQLCGLDPNIGLGGQRTTRVLALVTHARLFGCAVWWLVTIDGYTVVRERRDIKTLETVALSAV